MNFFCIISSVISSRFAGCGVGASGTGWEHVTRAVGILQGKGWGHVAGVGACGRGGGMWQGRGACGRGGGNEVGYTTI